MSNNQQSLSKLSAACVMVTASLLLSASVAQAQFRVGNDGRALDANNRIGSNGYNDAPRRQLAPSGNDIVTGNVTGGKQFRGRVDYTDPGAFRGRTAGVQTDNFVRSSSGVPLNGLNNNNAQQTTGFFGESRAAPPPSGYAMQASTGAYVPSNAAASRQGSDLRLGSVIGTPQTVLPAPGGLMLPGPVDSSTGSSIITASPLYGVRQWNNSDPNSRQFVDRFSQDTFSNSPDAMRLDDATLDRFRSELNTRPQSNTLESNDAQGSSAALPNSGLSANTDGAKDGSALNSSALPTDQMANTGLNTGPVAGGSTRNEITTAVQQSQLYSRLQDQFDRQGNITDQEAQRRFQLEQTVRSNANAQAAPNRLPDAPVGGDIRGGGATADRPVIAPTAPATQPVKVNSLAEGTTAKGLASLLTGAEESMKAGQFGAAIDRYDAAAKVAPNNPLITLGRANAQLGASYYGRAEADLRKAFSTGPALLEGQYDLINFLGEERLQFVIADLKQIAKDESTAPGPTFLLAYIARNMGNLRLAGDYLTETEKRIGGPDQMLETMRRVWRIPAVKE